MAKLPFKKCKGLTRQLQMEHRGISALIKNVDGRVLRHLLMDMQGVAQQEKRLMHPFDHALLRYNALQQICLAVYRKVWELGSCTGNARTKVTQNLWV